MSDNLAVWVYCDSPKHARKTARVEVFAKISAFGDCWNVKGGRVDGPGVETLTRPDGTVWVNHRCQLCGMNWPTGADRRDRVLDVVAADPKYRRAEGVSRISLRDLIVLASRQA